MHGGAAQGRRDRRRVAAGLSRGRLLEGAPGWSVVSGAVQGSIEPQFDLGPGDPTFTDIYPTVEQMKALVPDPLAYQYQHRDGLRAQ